MPPSTSPYFLKGVAYNPGGCACGRRSKVNDERRVECVQNAPNPHEFGVGPPTPSAAREVPSSKPGGAAGALKRYGNNRSSPIGIRHLRYQAQEKVDWSNRFENEYAKSTAKTTGTSHARGDEKSSEVSRVGDFPRWDRFWEAPAEAYPSRRERYMIMRNPLTKPCR